MNLKGYVVVVIGSGGDIGSRLLPALRDAGATVCSPNRKECDVTNGESVESYFGSLWGIHGRIDCLVNCQGAPGCVKPTMTLTDDEFREVLEIDLVGTLRTCRQAMRYMGSQGSGSIVNFSSMHALATYPERAAYAAAKAGVCGLTRALAVEWGPLNVRVNAILPGQVKHTRRTASHDETKLLDRSPTRRLVEVSALADACIFLLSSPSVNGHSLVVDDGWTASSWPYPHE